MPQLVFYLGRPVHRLGDLVQDQFAEAAAEPVNGPAAGTLVPGQPNGGRLEAPRRAAQFRSDIWSE